jgi:hypothetical protein
MVAAERSYWPMGKPTRGSRADSRTTSLVGKVLETAMTADESGSCSPHPGHGHCTLPLSSAQPISASLGSGVSTRAW